MELGRFKIGRDDYAWFQYGKESHCGCRFVTLFGIYFCWAGKDCKCQLCNNWDCNCQ